MTIKCSEKLEMRGEGEVVLSRQVAILCLMDVHHIHLTGESLALINET